MSRYPIKNKEVYAIRDLDPRLVSYLEKWSGGKLTKLRVLPFRGGSWVTIHCPPFWRWRLEGINNISYKNNTGNKLSLLHSALRLPLQEFFPNSLIHIATEVGRNDLVLDFGRKEDIFERIDDQAYETYKDWPPYDFRSKEEKLIRIPYIRLMNWN